MASPPKPISRNHFFTQTNRTVAANNGHFLALSSLFILPLFASIISLLTFLYINIHSPSAAAAAIVHPPLSILLSLLYAIFIFSLHVAGVATLTYSTHQGLAGKPANLSSSVKSLSKSFLPLASTTLASILCLLALLSICTGLLFLARSINLIAIEILGLDIKYGSNYNIGFRLFAIVIVALLLISWHTHLTLAGVIAVIESKRGFAPLRRSFCIIKGMKRASLFALWLRGISIWVIILALMAQILSGPKEWNFVALLQITYISTFMMTFIVQLVTSYAVLYLYIKDLHDEMGTEIQDDKISEECISMAVDDKNLVRESKVKALACFAVFIVGCATVVLVLNFELQAMFSNGI